MYSPVSSFEHFGIRNVTVDSVSLSEAGLFNTVLFSRLSSGEISLSLKYLLGAIEGKLTSLIFHTVRCNRNKIKSNEDRREGLNSKKG